MQNRLYQVISPQQQLVNNRCDDPYGKARTKNEPQWQLFLKTKKSRKEKKYAGSNAPQGTLGVICHLLEIAWIIELQPDKNYQSRQRHNGNQARKGR